MIQIPPNLPDPATPPRRPESANVQAVPAVLADKAGVNPGVVLNLPPPVLETPTDGMRPRDTTNQPGATQIDNEAAAVGVRQATGVSGLEVAVRQGLNTAGLPERLVKLLAQLERFSDKAGVPVMWPQPAELLASRPEEALLNLRRVLGDSMLFEMKRLQARLVPSAAAGAGGAVGAAASGSATTTAVATAQIATGLDDELPLPSSNLMAEFETASTEADAYAQGVSRPLANLANSSAHAPQENVPAMSQGAISVPDGAQARKVIFEDAAQSAQDEVTVRSGSDDEPGADQTLALRKAEVLNADSQAIKDAVRLLLHGELRWQGELSPGVFARLEREDVWEEDPRSPGALVKGTLVSVDLDLPNLGQLRIRGMFVKDAVRITMLPQEASRGALHEQWQDLRERLARRGLDGARVRLAEDGNV